MGLDRDWVDRTFAAPALLGASGVRFVVATRNGLEAAMQQHLSEGRESFYLIATPAGKSLYDALGFETVDELALWTLGHSEQFGDH